MNNNLNENVQYNQSNNDTFSSNNNRPLNNGNLNSECYRYSSNWENNPNGYNGRSNHVMALTKSCKVLAISYIVIWFFVIIFTVGTSFGFNFFYDKTYYGQPYPYDQDYDSTGDSVYMYGIYQYVQLLCNSGYACYMACFSITCALSLILLVLGIILIVKTYTLKKYYKEYRCLWIIFLFGLILLGIPSIVTSILTISACNTIESQNFIPSNQSK